MSTILNIENLSGLLLTSSVLFGAAAPSAKAIEMVDIHHPQPNDIVTDPVEVCGVGTGRHGEVTMQLLDDDETELSQDFFRVGGVGIWRNFCVTLPLSSVPETAQGELVVSTGTGPDGGPDAIIPVVFGEAIMDDYDGFRAHTVREGETLYSIAQEYYENPDDYQRIIDANPQRIDDIEDLDVGESLRVPLPRDYMR
ncbi:LysM peptidoglycan-binding domain-containing protein [Sodalinema gerasimenkoae]|uniref:LysM peptidoglycan-binding domain-containing protein n=1 Tax=Sodalinema gerasimenkoae TaxID=2862348 RepID=UPI00135851C5|nr:Gmad2 immunoglobulin-like domain-containing protein [Sodalinema gerasimenkoae]